MLKEAVKEQLGCSDEEEFVQTCEDVCKGGANAGFPGFCYYNDTCEFWRQNKAEITKRLQELASDLGEDMLAMVADFGCLKDLKLTPSQVGQAIWSGDDSDTDIQIHNALAWFALEEIAREVAEA